MASVMCVDTEMDLTHSIGGNIVINNNLEDTTMQCDQITILTIQTGSKGFSILVTGSNIIENYIVTKTDQFVNY